MCDTSRPSSSERGGVYASIVTLHDGTATDSDDARTVPETPDPEPELPDPHVRAVLAGHAGDAAGARELLDHPDARTRRSALSALVRAGAVTSKDLTAALADGDPWVRRRAAELVPRAAARGVAPPDLTPLLPDVDDRVTEMACFAAGELAEPSPRTVAAVVSIAGSHTDSLCRESAVAALGSWGRPEGREAVLAATGDIAPVRRRAVLALSQFDGPDVVEALRRLTSDRDLQVRQSAEDLLEIVEGHEIGGHAGRDHEPGRDEGAGPSGPTPFA